MKENCKGNGLLSIVWILGICVSTLFLGVLGQAGPVAAASDTWQPHALPASPTYPKTSLTAATGISCPSVSVCFVTGEYGQGDDSGGPASMYATTDGGQKWQIQSLPAAAFWLDSISCAITSECVAVGYSPGGGPLILTTVNGGARWTVPSLPASTKSAYGIEGVACPTSKVCFAVGSGPAGGVILRSTNGGAAWEAEAAPKGTSHYNGVSCDSSSTCTIVGGNSSQTTPPAVLTTVDGGTKWIARSSTSIVPGDSLYGISCPSAKECFATGGTNSGGGRLFRTTDGGTSWERQTLPSGLFGVGSVTCTSATSCFALGEDGTTAPSGPEKVLTTVNAGVTWQSQTFAQSGTEVQDTPITGIACSGASCFGSGNDNGPAFYKYVKS